MKSKQFFPLLLCFFMTSVTAGAEEKMTVEQFEEMGFAAVDAENRGSVNIGAIEAFRKLVFASMDTNDDKKVTVEEYLDWGFGAGLIAERLGKKDLFVAAKKVVFYYRDSNADGVLSEGEHRNSIIRDFRRADRNGDGLLSKQEFTDHFSEIAAIKAALK